MVCRWVEDSCANLKEGVTLWADYEKRKEEFSAWLDSCESRLNDPKVKTKADKESEFEDIVTQVRELKVQLGFLFFLYFFFEIRFL